VFPVLMTGITTLASLFWPILPALIGVTLGYIYIYARRGKKIMQSLINPSTTQGALTIGTASGLLVGLTPAL